MSRGESISIMEIITKLNEKKYNVNLCYLREMIRGIIREGKSLHEELNQIVEQYGAKIDIRSTVEVALFISNVMFGEEGTEVSNFTNETLDGWYEKTKDIFFLKLKQYRRCRERYRKIATFITCLPVTFDEWGDKSVNAFLESNLRTVTISPQFVVNRVGGVSMSQPVMPFSTAEIMHLMGFNLAIRFRSQEGMWDFLQKYSDIILGADEEKHLLFRGDTLFVYMILSEYYIIPFSDNDGEMARLIKEFHREYGSLQSPNVIIIG